MIRHCFDSKLKYFYQITFIGISSLTFTTCPTVYDHSGFMKTGALCNTHVLNGTWFSASVPVAIKPLW